MTVAQKTKSLKLDVTLSIDISYVLQRVRATELRNYHNFCNYLVFLIKLLQIRGKQHSATYHCSNYSSGCTINSIINMCSICRRFWCVVFLNTLYIIIKGERTRIYYPAMFTL